MAGEVKVMDFVQSAHVIVLFGKMAFRYGPYQPSKVGPILEKLDAEFGEDRCACIGLTLECGAPDDLEDHLRELLTSDVNPDNNIEPGRCRYCDCTEDRACFEGCAWANEDQTICDSPSCVAAGERDGHLMPPPTEKLLEGD